MFLGSPKTLQITGNLSLTSIGQTSQLTATATFVDGGPRNVTNQVKWEVSNASVARLQAATTTYPAWITPYLQLPGDMPQSIARKAREVTQGSTNAYDRATAIEAYLRTFFRDSSIRTYETPELARDALVVGQVDLLFDDGVSLAFWLNGTASKACCEFRGGPFAEPKFFGDGVGIAVSRSDTQLKAMIDTALERVRQSGRYEELLLRYFPQRVF